MIDILVVDAASRNPYAVDDIKRFPIFGKDRRCRLAEKIYSVFISYNFESTVMQMYGALFLYVSIQRFVLNFIGLTVLRKVLESEKTSKMQGNAYFVVIVIGLEIDLRIFSWVNAFYMFKN
ncbi:hypothetical protein T4D_13771 [Trichinella pseudospiralis]|uniref:Uncharacterized protein n=1 Tax=Trichinella pseudospiralis TaxID=6337 RepID=A0A0V1G207_TRIPS|nr:hypothetical protein T4D_13771 [Trichinella pseudospiralis]